MRGALKFSHFHSCDRDQLLKYLDTFLSFLTDIYIRVNAIFFLSLT